MLRQSFAFPCVPKTMNVNGRGNVLQSGQKQLLQLCNPDTWELQDLRMHICSMIASVVVEQFSGRQPASDDRDEWKADHL